MYTVTYLCKSSGNLTNGESGRHYAVGLGQKVGIHAPCGMGNSRKFGKDSKLVDNTQTVGGQSNIQMFHCAGTNFCSRSTSIGYLCWYLRDLESSQYVIGKRFNNHGKVGQTISVFQNQLQILKFSCYVHVYSHQQTIWT